MSASYPVWPHSSHGGGSGSREKKGTETGDWEMFIPGFLELATLVHDE